MSKKDLSEIIVIADSSGSMDPLTTETVGSINSLIKGQKAVPGEANFTLAIFDSEYKLYHNAVPINQVPELTEDQYRMGGMTALYDAIGKTFIEVGTRLSLMKEEDRPEKVIVTIITDGDENSSKEWRGEEGRVKIQEMVKHQQEKYNWKVMFLGAGIDAIKQGSSIGVQTSGSLSYNSTKRGMGVAYASIGNVVTSLRSATLDSYKETVAEFSDEDILNNAPDKA